MLNWIPGRANRVVACLVLAMAGCRDHDPALPPQTVRVLSVHPQHSGVLVSFFDTHTGKQASMRVEAGDPVPQPGERWRIVRAQHSYKQYHLLDREPE
jgi:hypothetical protein